MLSMVTGVAAFLVPRRAYMLGAAFCLCFAFGIGRAALAETPPPSVFWQDIRQRVSYEGVVVADPDLRDANQRVQVRVLRGGQATSILVVAPRTPVVQVGDTVSIYGTLLPPAPFTDDSGRIFRYDKYLERDGVRFIMQFATLRVIEPAPWHSLPAVLARMKRAFQGGLQATLPEPHASLAGGITIGGKSGLGNELKDAFTRSGLVHMVVLSGHNVMVVASWVIAVFAFVFARSVSIFGRRVPRGASIGFGVIALILFVGIAGASATAIRAALMAIIALYARASGRSYAAGRALLLVIVLMLIWNPLYLVFDPGFGLSVVATAGLIWLAPLIEAWLEKRFALTNAFWKNVIATTVAAQTAVLPLLLYETGNLSIVAFPANLLAAPVIPLAMALSALAGFAGMLFNSVAPWLGILVAFPSYLLSTYLVYIAQKSAGLPFAALTIPPFPFWLVPATYAAYMAVAYWMSAKVSKIPILRTTGRT